MSENNVGGVACYPYTSYTAFVDGAPVIIYENDTDLKTHSITYSLQFSQSQFSTPSTNGTLKFYLILEYDNGSKKCKKICVTRAQFLQSRTAVERAVKRILVTATSDAKSDKGVPVLIQLQSLVVAFDNTQNDMVIKNIVSKNRGLIRFDQNVPVGDSNNFGVNNNWSEGKKNKDGKVKKSKKQCKNICNSKKSSISKNGEFR